MTLVYVASFSSASAPMVRRAARLAPRRSQAARAIRLGLMPMFMLLRVLKGSFNCVPGKHGVVGGMTGFPFHADSTSSPNISSL